MNRVLILCKENTGNQLNQKIEHSKTEKVFIHEIPDMYLPNYHIDNTVRNEDNKENLNDFPVYIDTVMNDINMYSIDTVVFALPNAMLKLVTEAFRGISNVDFCVLSEYTDKTVFDLFEDCVQIDINKPRLRMVQLNISDHCNLNCKGCANYSNLIEKAGFYDLQSYKDDLIQLKQFFWGIERVKIMGGEPLLNERIEEYIKITCDIFPDALIEVGTNGLLIRKDKTSLFNCMRESHAMFVISIYPKTREIQKRVEELLDSEHVRYTIYRFKGEFIKYLYEKPYWSAEEGYRHCPARECHCLENGWLAVCGRPLFLKRINERFGLNIPSDKGKWNIYQINMDGWMLDALLRTPFETCQYCGKREYFDWDVSRSSTISKGDWIIEQND